MLKKKDILVVAALLVLALVLYAVSGLLPKTDLSEKTADATLAPDAVVYLDETPAPTAQMETTAVPQEPEQPEETTVIEATAEPTAAPEEAAAFGPMPKPQTEEIKGYVVLTMGGRQYGDPIKMDRDKIITLKQENGAINTVHITPEKVFMESSTCENQDCVGQGEITLDNYQTRVLSTYVICLPNNVTIEFVPAQ